MGDVLFFGYVFVVVVYVFVGVWFGYVGKFGFEFVEFEVMGEGFEFVVSGFGVIGC